MTFVSVHCPHCESEPGSNVGKRPAAHSAIWASIQSVPEGVCCLPTATAGVCPR